MCIRDFEYSAVCPLGYLRATYHVYKIGCLLVRGISLPVPQMFVIVIENILLGGVGGGNLTSICDVAATASMAADERPS